MNEGLKQIFAMLQQHNMKRIIFELKDEKILKIGFFRTDYKSMSNEIDYELLDRSSMDYLSLILGNMIQMNVESTVEEDINSSDNLDQSNNKE